MNRPTMTLGLPFANASRHPIARARHRRRAYRALSAIGLLIVSLLAGALPASGEPLLRNIRISTISTSDVEASAQAYVEHLGYQRVETGTVSLALAQAWQAPAVAGRPYALLQSPDGDPSFLRFVEVKMPPDYRPMTTAGWNAVELLSRDPYEVYEALKDSVFSNIGQPAPLDVAPTIHATQFLGPNQEVIYLTADLGDNPITTLARTPSLVGRTFIVILAGASVDRISDYYQTLFDLPEAFRTTTPIGVLSRAQNLSADFRYDLALLRLADFSHSMELDGYPDAPPRETLDGELPPGIAIVSFCIADFPEAAQQQFLAPPLAGPGLAYEGGQLAVLRGSAGELLELIVCGEQSAE